MQMRLVCLVGEAFVVGCGLLRAGTNCGARQSARAARIFSASVPPANRAVHKITPATQTAAPCLDSWRGIARTDIANTSYTAPLWTYVNFARSRRTRGLKSKDRAGLGRVESGRAACASLLVGFRSPVPGSLGIFFRETNMYPRY